MVSNFALLSNLLLASAALAVPSSSPVGAPLAPSHETRQSSNSNNAIYWTGASITKTNGTFTSASATFDTPPPPYDDSNGTLSFWVGIDGATCENRASVLQAGVTTTVVDGAATYDAWSSWNTNDPNHFTTLTIGSGDTITLIVLLTSDTSGTVYIKNENTGQLVWEAYTVDSTHALCGSSAEWVVDVPEGTLAQVGGLILTRAYASGPDGYVYKPYNVQDGAVLGNMTQNGTLAMATLIGSDGTSLGIIQAIFLQ